MKNYYINPLSIWLSIQYSRYICRTNYTQMNYLETEINITTILQNKTQNLCSSFLAT